MTTLMVNFEIHEPDISRFWLKVDKEASMASGGSDCWLWIKERSVAGYGRFLLRGRMLMAHRVSYQIVKGPVPPGMFVCHHCDNRACVNPDHLYAGTAQDNMRDMHQRGRANRQAGDAHYIRRNPHMNPSLRFPERHIRGHRHHWHGQKRAYGVGEAPACKIDARKAASVRWFFATRRYTPKEIALATGVPVGNVYAIISNRSWKGVMPGVNPWEFTIPAPEHTMSSSPKIDGMAVSLPYTGISGKKHTIHAKPVPAL